LELFYRAKRVQDCVDAQRRLLELCQTLVITHTDWDGIPQHRPGVPPSVNGLYNHRDEEPMF
jgi:hypothetical protein